MAHHPTLQKEADELLAQGVIELSTGGAGCYSNTFVGPKHSGGFSPYSVLIDLITRYTYISLRCLLSNIYGNLFNKVAMPFLLISRMLIYGIPIVQHHHHF